MFDFFLSHSRSNKELARLVYYTSIANGLSVWYDEGFLNLGDNLDEAFREGIESSKSYLLLLSKEALESPWVNIEIELALENKKQHPDFKIQVVRLDDTALPLELEKFQYQHWQVEDEPGSVLKLISSLTGKDVFTGITGQAFLTGIPSLAFPNELGTIAEHSRNYVLYYLSHLQALFTAMATNDYGGSLSETIQKLQRLSIFGHVPIIQGGILPLPGGEYELIHGVPMRRPPRPTFAEQTGNYVFEVSHNDEISTRFRAKVVGSGELVTHPIPLKLTIELHAEL